MSRSVRFSSLLIQIAAVLVICAPKELSAQTIPFGRFTFFVLAPVSDPEGITVGPDGNIWFAETRAGKIGRLANGVLSEFTTPSGAGPGIVAGPDGALWFCGLNAVDRITTSGVITEFPMPTPLLFSGPTWITLGPDGNLWFTEEGKQKVGRITPAGVVTEFDVGMNVYPQNITTGPDGNLWFVGYGGAIGRITTAGVLTLFGVPTPGAYPFGITVGPDRALWFTMPGVDKIGRITTDGVITDEFEISRPPDAFLSCPGPITAGLDGRLWFGEGCGSSIGSITIAGRVTHYSYKSFNQVGIPLGITVGPDRNIWFTDLYSHVVGRLVIHPNSNPH